ncbi:MAG: DUF362 domain-containing protein [Methanomicrobiales archaeon]
MSKVFFSDFRSRSINENKLNKIIKLFKKSRMDEIVDKGDLTAIKIHFGEEGNDSFLNPIFIRVIVDELYKLGAEPFITDTNTLYFGSRHNAVNHHKTAIKHGFDFAVVGAPVIISDGLAGNYYHNVKINKKHFKNVKIAGNIEEANSIVVLSHFKGHSMCGFGGALKNLAMGCASAGGKIDQHECSKPIITEKCTLCKTCNTLCPFNAIFLGEKKAEIDKELCIACNLCMAECPSSAIEMDFQSLPEFMERMMEYAYGSVKNKPDKVCYFNFLMNITPDCDCEAFSDANIVQDIGILASKDPVALDTASYELVNQQKAFEESEIKSNLDKGEDKFRGIWPKVDGWIQLKYAQELGLGSMNYDLIKI